MTLPEHPAGPTGTDRLTETLAGLRDGVAGPPPRSAAAARRTASRRHGARLAVAAAAVAAVVVGVPLGVSLGSTEAAPPVAPSTEEPSLRPVVPTLAPSAVPSVQPPGPAPDASEVPSAAPSVEPSTPPDPEPASTPPDGPLQVESSDTGGVSAGELAGVDLGTEELGPDGSLSGQVTWSLDPCGPTAWPSDPARTGWASLSRGLGDGVEVRQVAVYADEADATAVLDGFRRAADACWAPPGDTSAPHIWQETTPDGEASTVFAGMVRAFDTRDLETWGAREGAYFVALREGRTVAMVSYGHLYYGGYMALYQGDTRLGAGTEAVPEDGAAESVRQSLADVRADAQQLLDEHAP